MTNIVGFIASSVARNASNYCWRTRTDGNTALNDIANVNSVTEDAVIARRVVWCVDATDCRVAAVDGAIDTIIDNAVTMTLVIAKRLWGDRNHFPEPVALGVMADRDLSSAGTFFDTTKLR